MDDVIGRRKIKMGQRSHPDLATIKPSYRGLGGFHPAPSANLPSGVALTVTLLSISVGFCELAFWKVKAACHPAMNACSAVMFLSLNCWNA